MNVVSFANSVLRLRTSMPNPSLNRTRRVRAFCLTNVTGGRLVSLIRWASEVAASTSNPTSRCN